MTEQTKRGSLPSDKQEFSAENLPVLKAAAADLQYLLERGYPAEGAARFIGDHLQLSGRQRLAVVRSVAAADQLASRKSREVTEIAGETMYIDGFNVIISLEIAFSQSMLFLCADGTVRDMAGLHGSYRLIPETDHAVRALLQTLHELRIGKAVICLDRQISNSGRLRQRIGELAEACGFEAEVRLEQAVDALLKTKPLIASADAFVLDACDRWFNLARTVIARQIGSYGYIELTA